MTKNKNALRKNKKSIRPKLLLTVGIILALAAGSFWYWQEQDQNASKKLEKGPTTIGPNTKGDAGSQNPSDDKNQNGDDDNNDKSSNNSANTSSSLKVPEGDFVSNHEPNLDGNPAPNTIESVCITTPGATCSISFEKNGTIKGLPAQTADSEGATYWTWKLQDYGLTEGTWDITAKAALGGQTKTAADPRQLNVKP